MSQTREVYRPGNPYQPEARVKTANSFITSQGLEKLSLKARKLLYIAIAQCRMEDTGFYTYHITAKDYADMMEVSESEVYKSADKITKELLTAYIEIQQGTNRRGVPQWTRIPLFALCQYKNGVITFEINPRMADVLLGLTHDFSKPLLSDFLPMQSTYSMAIWHLMQREMESQWPGIRGVFYFDLFLDELRQVTGTQDKFTNVGGTSGFKAKVFDKAIREIRVSAWVEVSYTDIKEGRKIIGFRCRAVSSFHMSEKDITRETKSKISRIEAQQKAREIQNRF